MTYESSDDPYLVNNSKILRNILAISDENSLLNAEAEISSVTIATMTLPVSFKISDIDTDFYLSVHHEIFMHIYDWAGLIRSIDISSDLSRFAHASYIRQELDRVLAELRADRRLTSQSRDTVLEALTYYYAEINAIHPFREGNGRTLRTFLRLLASRIGWDIDWAQMDPEENIEASKQSLMSDPILLKSMLGKLLSPLH